MSARCGAQGPGTTTAIPTTPTGGGARDGGAKTAPAEPKGTPDQNAGPDGSHASYARVDQAPDGAKPNDAKSNGAGRATEAGAGGRTFASPLARRIAKQEGIDIAAVTGSGPHGRVIQRDVQAAIEGGAAKAGAAPAMATKAVEPETAAPKPEPKSVPAAGGVATGMTTDQVKAMFEPGSYEEITLDGMRRTIAKRLVESKQTVPHFYLSIDVELDALLALRTQVNAGAAKDKDGKPAFKLSVNDFVIKGLALALQRVPNANAVWAGDRILKFKNSDVGVAVAIEGGLFTPVIRRAEQKTLSTISAEMKDLAGRARTKKLKPEEYQGGSTAVSNLGMFGIKSFSAVINPPHGTILAVGGGEARVVAKDGQPAVVQAMTVTLSVDHRVVDGALGAELLAAFKGLIENPMGMLV